MSEFTIMEDVMLSEGALSFTDELDDLFPEEFLVKGTAMKKSPGHLSVASVDSGFGYASPNRSLPDLDSNSLCLQDLIEEDEGAEGCSFAEFLTANDVDLHSVEYQQNQAGTGAVYPPTSTSENQAMETSGTIGHDVSNVYSIPDTDVETKDDLAQLLDSVSANNTQTQELTSDTGSATCQEVYPSTTSTTRTRGALRATRGGKTVALAASAGASKPASPTGPSPTPASRVTRSKTGARKPPKQAKTEIENTDMEDVDQCNKNAIQARLNRQKKKAYIQGLEEQVEALSKENEQLHKDSKKYLNERDSLEEQVKYYKSVLANDSQLAGLLKNIGNVKNVKLTTSFETSRKRSHDHDHDYGVAPSTSKKMKIQATDVKMSGGVCLHVDKDNVSLEFCSQCSKMANGAGRGGSQS